MDRVEQRPKGSAFVCFKHSSGLATCLAHRQPMNLLGRLLIVTAAVSKQDAAVLLEKKTTKTQSEDKRNLYLAREGAIESNTAQYKSLSAQDRTKRDNMLQEASQKMRNPNYFVSKTRLSVHNLPLTLDEKELGTIFSKAGNGRALQIKIVRSADRTDERGIPRSKGFGFVEFSNHEEALAALRGINNNPEIFGSDRRPVVMFAWENAQIVHQREERMKKSNNVARLRSANQDPAKWAAIDKRKGLAVPGRASAQVQPWIDKVADGAFVKKTGKRNNWSEPAGAANTVAASSRSKMGVATRAREITEAPSKRLKAHVVAAPVTVPADPTILSKVPRKTPTRVVGDLPTKKTVLKTADNFDGLVSAYKRKLEASG